MFAPHRTTVCALQTSLTVVVQLPVPTSEVSMLEAVLVQVSPGGIIWTHPARCRVISAASSLSRLSHKGMVRAMRSPALLPCLSRHSLTLDAVIRTASS